jgi:hypothetical protein
MVDQNDIRQYTSKPQTIIIIYDQPKVNVVRHYTRTIIRSVNPDEYRKKYDNVLLDTATLLELIRRLNIQESMVEILKNTNSFFFFHKLNFYRLHHQRSDKIN